MRSLAARPSFRALAGTLLGNVPGLALPFLITAHVGAGRLTDAWFYAFAIAVFGSSIVSLALEANVMPVATHHRRQGRRRLRAFASSLLRRSIAATVAGYVLVGAVAAASVLVRDNWTAEEKELCVQIIAVLGVYLAAVAATAVINGCLYAFGSFFVTTATVSLRSLLPVPVLFLAPAGAPGLLACAVALAAGECLRAVLLGARLRRLIGALEEPDPATAPAGDPPPVWSTALPYALAMVLFGSSQVVDRVIAGSLEPGAVTVLDLAEKVFYVPVTILMSSVLLVAGTRWATASIDRPADLAPDFHATVRRIAVLSLALAAATIAAAVVLLVTVDATVAGVSTTTFCAVLALLMLGFPAAVVTNAGVRLMTALRRTRTFPLLAVASLGANVAGGSAGAALLGVEGIALSGSVWRVLNLVLILVLSAAALRDVGRSAAGPPAAREPLPVGPSLRLEA